MSLEGGRRKGTYEILLREPGPKPDHLEEAPLIAFLSHYSPSIFLCDTGWAMGTEEKRQVLPLGVPSLAGKSEPKTVNKGTPGVWEDPGVHPRLPEKNKLEQGSQGQVGTTQVAMVREGIPDRGNICKSSEMSVLTAACSPKWLEAQL